MKYFLETLPPSFRIASNSRYKTLNYAIIKYLIDHFFCYNNQGIVGEAKCQKKSANHCWKSTEIHPKLQFFSICLSLKPHKIQMKKDNSKFQKQASLLVFCLIFLFSDQPSKSSSCPFIKAKRKRPKWLSLWPSGWTYIRTRYMIVVREPKISRSTPPTALFGVSIASSWPPSRIFCAKITLD